MKGTLTVIGSNHKSYCKGRVFWASEFSDNWKITHSEAFPQLYRLQYEDENISIWMRYDRDGVKM